MKAASIDGPFGLLTACPMFNIEMLYCEFDFWANKMLACLHVDQQSSLDRTTVIVET